MPSNTEAESIEEGQRYAKSPLTDNYYRVTEWVDKGDGKLVAKNKERVDREEVPDDALRDLGEEP